MGIKVEPPRQQKTDDGPYWQWLHRMWFRLTQAGQLAISQFDASGATAANQYVKVNAGTSAFEYVTLGATSPIVVTHGTNTTGISHGTSGVAAGTYGGTLGFAQVGLNATGHATYGTSASVSSVFDAVFSGTAGALLYRGTGGWIALAAGTSGQVLTMGTSGLPEWQ